MLKGVKDNKNLIILSILVGILVLAATGIAFAAIFSSHVNMKGEISTGKITNVIGEDISTFDIKLLEQGMPVDYSNETLTFGYAGDTKDFTLNLHNNTNFFLRYRYKISYPYILEEDNLLASAILVYYDDIFVGTLSSLLLEADLAEEVGALPEGGYILPVLNNSAGESVNKLSFELHMAAEEGYYKDKAVEIAITAYISTPDYQTEFAVYNEVDLAHAIEDINEGIEDAKIILCDNIVLGSNALLAYPVTIDLLGKNLIFNGNNIILQGQGKYTLLSTQNIFTGSLPTQESGGFKLDSVDAYLDIKPFSASEYYTNSVVVTAFDSVGASTMLISLFEQKLKYGIKGGEQIQLFGANSFYLGKIVAKYENGTNLTDSISFGVTSKTYLTHITIDEQKLDFKVLGGGDESIYQSIIANELRHIPNIENDLLENISRDLFLPVSLKAKNATIEWQSSNTEYIDNTGKIGIDLEGDTQILLTAIIRINQSVFVHHFEFVVYTLDNAKRFAYFLALINPITINTINYFHPLPVVNADSDYDYHIFPMPSTSDIGLISLAYSIDAEYDYLTLIKEYTTPGVLDNVEYSVGLNQAVFYNYAQVNIDAVFAKGKTTEFSGIINVLIEFGDLTELHNLVYNYIEGELGSHDVLENILSTRKSMGMSLEKGDFDMPTSYNNYTIEYFADKASAGVPIGAINENTGIVSISTEEEYATIHIDATKLLDTPSAIPLYVKISNEKVSEPIVRVLYFETPAAIHNDQNGFYDSSVFYSIKYQVFQQLPPIERGNASGFAENGQNSTVSFNSVADYILLRDIDFVEQLVLQPYNGNILMQLLNWASSTTNMGDNLSSYMTGNTYESNGERYILDEEAAAIRSYLEYIIDGKSDINKTAFLAKWDALWEANTYLDETGKIVGYPSKIDEISTEIGKISSFKQGSGVNKSTAEFKFRELLAWATNMQDFGDTNSPAEPRVKGGPPNSGIVGLQAGDKKYNGWVVRDGLPTISTSYTIPKGASPHNPDSPLATGGEEGVITYFFEQILIEPDTIKSLWEEALIFPRFYKPDGKTNIYQGIMEYLKDKLLVEDYLTIYRLLIGSQNANDVTNVYTSDAGLKYTYITSLDASTRGLRYFGKLSSLKVIKGAEISGRANLSIFSETATLGAFFDRLTIYQPWLQTLHLRGVAYKGEAELNIKNIVRFNYLKNIDLSYNSGIAMLGEMTNLPNLKNVSNLDIRYIKNGGEYHQDYFTAMLTFIKSTAPNAVLLYGNGSEQTFSLSGYSQSVIDAYYALALLNDLDYFAGEYLQLAEKIYTSGTASSDIIWQLESGNPITATAYYDFPSYSGTGVARDIVTQIAGYYYVGSSSVTVSKIQYNSNSVYTLTSGGLGGRVSLTVYSTMSTQSALQSASNNRYYYYTGDNFQVGSTWYLKNSIIRKTSNGLTTYFSGVLPLNATTVPQALTLAKTTRYFLHNNSSNTTALYHKNSTSGTTVTFAANTLYSISFGTSGAVFSAVGNPAQARNTLTLKGLLGNALNAPHTINNYYFYQGDQTTVSGKTYKHNYYYRLIINSGGVAELVEQDMGYTYSVYGGEDGFVSIPIAYKGSGVDKVFQPLQPAPNEYTWTFEPFGIYTVVKDLVNGGYYLKTFGTASFVETDSGLRLSNDRYYPNEGDYYGGTGGSEEVVLTASIKVGDVLYTRKFSVLVIG